MSEFDSPAAVREAIAADLSAASGGDVEVELNPDVSIGQLDGRCVDTLASEFDATDVDAAVLQTGDERVEESLHSHLLRSLCPVTAQPDMGSLEIRYSGPRIDGGALLRYIVSFRQHQDFHEACVERIFVDILERCQPERLSVYARYTRRGGIDINPFRSSDTSSPTNTRLWRQ